ncbi:MAG: NAD-dependent epimerase/dehydratase family protein [Planctomycetota bacterium]
MSAKVGRREDWQGEHVLVTGGAGFIGSHLASALAEVGARVTVLDDLSTGDIENLLPSLADGQVRLLRGSILDNRALVRAFRDVGHVFHLAATVGVQRVLERPLEAIHVNVHGTQRVLAQASKCGARTLIASSSEVYGPQSGPLKESLPLVMGPTDTIRWSYGCAKALSEYEAFEHHRRFGLPVTVARFFNVIGPRQTGRYGMVVPRFVSAALRGDPLHVVGDGSQTRSFCDVRDTVEAILRLAESEESIGQVCNVGSDDEISIATLAERIVAWTGSASPIVPVPPETVYPGGFADIERRCPSLDRLEALTGFRPAISLEESIRHIAAGIASRGELEEGASG